MNTGWARPLFLDPRLDISLDFPNAQYLSDFIYAQGRLYFNKKFYAFY